MKPKSRTNQPVSGVSKLVEQAIQADKDILSKIKVEYGGEDDKITYYYFPKGIMPLSITINTHTLFFKDYQAVGSNGNPVEGYETEEMIFSNTDNYISFVGDISEQVINNLVYVNFNSSVPFPLIGNSYYLFFPVKSSGTKLYYHHYNDLDSELILDFYSKTSSDLKGNLTNLYHDLAHNAISITATALKYPVIYTEYDGTQITIKYIDKTGSVVTKLIKPSDYIEGSPVEY